VARVVFCFLIIASKKQSAKRYRLLSYCLKCLLPKRSPYQFIRGQRHNVFSVLVNKFAIRFLKQLVLLLLFRVTVSLLKAFTKVYSIWYVEWAAACGDS